MSDEQPQTQAPAIRPPSNGVREWIAITVAFVSTMSSAGVIVGSKEILLNRPWPIVALAGIVSALAAVYVVCRTVQKINGVRVLLPFAVGLAAFVTTLAITVRMEGASPSAVLAHLTTRPAR